MITHKALTLLFLVFALAFAELNLGIKEDMSVRLGKTKTGGKDNDGDRQYVWSSIVKLNKDKEAKEVITDSQMIALVHHASDEMNADADFKGAPAGLQPSVMTALLVGDEVYLASSMKGDYSFIYEHNAKPKKGKKAGTGEVRAHVPEEIKTALGKAKEPPRENDQHKNDASCGEVMASYTYLLKNHGAKLQGQNARTIAWIHDKSKNQAYDPCGTGDKVWGCDAFCTKMGFKVIDTKIPEDKKENIPGISKHSQQELMTPALQKEVAEIRDTLKQEEEEKNKEAQRKKEQRKKEAEERRKKEAEEKKKKEEEEKKKKEAEAKKKKEEEEKKKKEAEAKKKKEAEAKKKKEEEEKKKKDKGNGGKKTPGVSKPAVQGKREVTWQA
ncbi:hypothetical protein BDV38DRAFT_279899 [Aspergillus pseudotamarii]|uniref:Uncharacterized protein n=1 Tax=Aspergillus pseudotamarii TaxID=132259 RepID=A0A5N6T3P3_ASPPS|nr:uncharacterized protein BDV38DRAFT_279899 [Aspergillus pseudotamarii]KAE8140926.1 hypothetical protein BDV38DRAFT_279899 [Aspergillus pseudotamarii]